jgi:hypothetical protein
MHNYLLFAFDNYYPSGGMEDLKIKFNTYEEFENNFRFYHHDTFQLVNTQENLSYQEFSTSITHHVGVDNIKIIQELRKEELMKWIKNRV